MTAVIRDFSVPTSPLDNKVVLITGGTGSFGKAFTRHVLAHHKPAKLIVFSRDELKQFDMQNEITDERIRFFLGDVRDANRLRRAFSGVDIVIHAAALKQVPAAEYNPFEAVQTNIIGAENVINAAIDAKVRRVVALSTDKAVNPLNLYGATKLCSDKLFVAGNSYAGSQDIRFSVVRYGNVVGSRGSVVPFFRDRVATGVLPITDPRMTRFWITIQQGVDFVISTISRMLGGEIFVPKIPSMNIMDLAKAIAPAARCETVGIRPGEKLHELLIPQDDARSCVEFDEYFVLKPHYNFWGAQNWDHGGSVSEEFSYRSDNNTEWLTVEQLQTLIAG